MKYKVMTTFLSGKKNKIFKSGDIITKDDLPPGAAEIAEYEKKIKAIDEYEPSEPVFVDSFNIEFGYELISVLPYAYYLYTKGLLKGTRSGIDTKHLYWFSPNHQENPEPRGWQNMQKAWAAKIPNIHIHNPTLDSQFKPPLLHIQSYRHDGQHIPYNPIESTLKKLYPRDIPFICICNRINIEWGKAAINYFDRETLHEMFITLKDSYNIIYFNIEGRTEFYDGVDPIQIGDFDLAKLHGITTIHDIHNQISQHLPGTSFNQVQMMMMSLSSAFITMNGGYSIMASYFKGLNIIYSKECREMLPNINSFYRWYHRFSGSRIVHVEDYNALFRQINLNLLNNDPLINIIIRTHNRPNYLKECIDSIEAQSYKKTNIIVGYHTEQDHLIPYKVRQVKYDKHTAHIPIHPDRVNYGKPFPSNHYLNILIREVQDGYIIILDDDDAFTTTDALQMIVDAIKTNEEALIMWRLHLHMEDKKIPSDENWMKTPVARDISGITFCCHHAELKKEWIEPYRLADFRLIRNLYSRLDKVYIDLNLTKMQDDKCNFGNQKDKSIN